MTAPLLSIANEVAISIFAASSVLRPWVLLSACISGIILNACKWPPVSKYFLKALVMRVRARRALRAVREGKGLYSR